MNEPKKSLESRGIQAIKAHQFTSMVVGAIIIALFLVYVALSLYRSSGTLQLDLSRPGYDAAREEAAKNNEQFRGFAADGPIDSESLNEFEKLYTEKAAEALIEFDAFSGDVLNDRALSLEEAQQQ